MSKHKDLKEPMSDRCIGCSKYLVCLERYNKPLFEEVEKSQKETEPKRIIEKEDTYTPPVIKERISMKARLAYVWLFGGVIFLSTCFMVPALTNDYFMKSPFTFVEVLLAISILYGIYEAVNRYLMKRVEGFKHSTVKNVSTLVLVALLTEIVMTLLISLGKSDFIYWVIPWPCGIPLAVILIFYLCLIGIIKLYKIITKLIRKNRRKSNDMK